MRQPLAVNIAKVAKMNNYDKKIIAFLIGFFILTSLLTISMVAIVIKFLVGC